MSMNPPPIKDIVEAALLSAGEPLSIERLLGLFAEHECPERDELRGVIEALAAEWTGRPLELVQVSSGYRFQVRSDFTPWLGRLAEERPPRYSRALLETLALIVYRQPITRAGIEEIRGVTVSSSIIKTLLDREWIRVVGHRDVPGKPALYGTTKKFLDYFSLKSLSDLPPLADVRPIDHLQEELPLAAASGEESAAAGQGDSGYRDRQADRPLPQNRTPSRDGSGDAEQEAEETAEALS